MIEKGQRLLAGDILRNDRAGDENPYKYTIYSMREQLGSMKVIACIGYDGRTVRYAEHNNRLVVVGHIVVGQLKEYADFKDALAQLRKMNGV